MLYNLKHPMSEKPSEVMGQPLNAKEDLPALRSVSEAKVIPEGMTSEEFEQKEKTPEEKIGSLRTEYSANFSEWQRFQKENKKGSAETDVKEANRAAQEEGLAKKSETSYAEYQQAIRDLVNSELEKERNESMKEWTVEQVEERLAVKKAELIQKFVIEEGEILEKAKSEAWPPKEKAWWQNALESYSNLPRLQKLAYSAAAGTVLVATLGGVASVTSVTGIFALKAARAGLGSFATPAINKFIGGILGKKLEKEKVKKEEEFLKSDKGLEDIQKEYQNFLERQKKIKARNKYLGIGASIAAGIGITSLSSLAEGSAADLLGLKPSISNIPDKSADGRLINPEPKSYMPGHEPIERGDAVAVPEAELNYDSTPAAPKSEVPPPADIPEQVSENSADLAAQTERLTVRQDEGFWQPVSREVEFRIKADPEKYGLSAADVASEDSPELARAVARETNQILRINKYIDSTGEVWFGKPGATLNLSEDGKVLTVSEDADLRSLDYSDSPTAESSAVRTAEPPAPAELGDQPVPVGERNFSAFRNLEQPIEPAAAATPEIIPVEEPWRTEGLTAHEELEPLVRRAEELGDQLDEDFFSKLEQAPLSELDKYEDVLTGGESEISQIKELTDSLRADGLEPPSAYLEITDSLRSRLEHLQEIKAERLEQFAKFEKTLPPDYASNSALTVKQYLEIESAKFDIPGQPSSRALEDFLVSANPADSEMGLKIKDFMMSRFNDSGFQVNRFSYEVPELAVRVYPQTISLAVESHAQINLAKIELPEYSQELDAILSDARHSSLADFRKNFEQAPELNLLKEDITRLCAATSEKIKVLESSGWTVGSDVKNSINEVIKKTMELDSLSYAYEQKWKDWLHDAGFENPQDYVRSIAEAKDNAGQPVSIDLGSVLDMSKNYTPSQIGKFADFVDEVGKLAKNLTPEELAEARKLPVDQFIKQNIEL